jgi:cyanate lyase
MASELDYNKLVALVKKDNDITQAQAAVKLGLSVGQVSMLKFQQAKVEAGVLAKIPGTTKAIKEARDKKGLRWEAIAAATGLSPAGVKAKYEEGGGNAADSYTGRGRNFAASGNGSARKPAARKPAARKPAARAAGKPGARKPASKPAAKRSSGAAARRSTGVVRRTTKKTAGNPS